MRAGIAALLVASTACSTTASHTERPPAAATSTLPAVGANAIVYGTWSAIPPAPLTVRYGSVRAWTGNEMLVVGGQEPDFTPGIPPTVDLDGAAFDPATGRWRRLPRAPIPVGPSSASAWTGSQLFVWSGGVAGLFDAGALFDAATNRWRRLPTSPLTPRSYAITVWTGLDVLVLGGDTHIDNSAPLSDAATYDPSTDRWTRAPTVPEVPGHVRMGNTELALQPVAVWTGDEVLVWFPWYRHRRPVPGVQDPAGLDLFSWTPGSNRWKVVRTTGEAPVVAAAAYWTGSEVVLPASRSSVFEPGITEPTAPGSIFDPQTDRYRATTPSPTGPPDVGLWTGAALVSGTFAPPVDGRANGLAASVWDLATERWSHMPNWSTPYADLFWTGRQIVALGGNASASHPGVLRGQILTPAAGG